MYQRTLEHSDSRHSVRSPSFVGIVAVGLAAVVVPLLAMVTISQPLLATAIVAGLLVVSGIRGLRGGDGRVEHDAETAGTGGDRLEQVLLTFRHGSDADQ